MDFAYKKKWPNIWWLTQVNTGPCLGEITHSSLGWHLTVSTWFHVASPTQQFIHTCDWQVATRLFYWMLLSKSKITVSGIVFSIGRMAHIHTQHNLFNVGFAGKGVLKWHWGLIPIWWRAQKTVSQSLCASDDCLLYAGYFCSTCLHLFMACEICSLWCFLLFCQCAHFLITNWQKQQEWQTTKLKVPPKW